MSLPPKHPLITINPNIAFGKPVLKDTRISVDFILELLAAGQTPKQILKGYPHLTEEKIKAALEYAAARLRNEHVYLIDKLPADVSSPHEVAHR